MDPEIREAILGHSSKQRLVAERYGRISDLEFVNAIDAMTCDHGTTEILATIKEKPLKGDQSSERLQKNVNWMLTEPATRLIQ
jgi:hypothetical protein